MPTYKACRVTFEGIRYEISGSGAVWPVLREMESAPPSKELAASVRIEAARQIRNRNARDRGEAMRDLGLVRTSCGWE